MQQKYYKYYRYIRTFWKTEALIILMSLLTVPLSLIIPYLTKMVIDKAYVNRDIKLFTVLALLGSAVFALTGIFTGISTYLNKYINLRIKLDLNRKIFEKVRKLPYKFFQDSSVGENTYKINYDITQPGILITNVMPQIISAILRSIFIFVVIFFIDWKMATLALALNPFLYLLPVYFNNKLKTAYEIWIENAQGIFKRLHEAFANIQLIKVFGKGRYEAKRHVGSLIKDTRLSLKNTRLETIGSFTNNMGGKIISGLLLFYGGYQVLKGRMSLGSLTAISIYLGQLAFLQGSFSQLWRQITTAFVSLGRLNIILDAKSESVESNDAVSVEFAKGDIEFKDVSFGYNKGTLILKDLSFRVEDGSKIALVGPSGCGKTTIANLILRLYTPEKGEIFIDSHSLKDIRNNSYLAQGFYNCQNGLGLFPGRPLRNNRYPSQYTYAVCNALFYLIFFSGGHNNHRGGA